MDSNGIPLDTSSQAIVREQVREIKSRLQEYIDRDDDTTNPQIKTICSYFLGMLAPGKTIDTIFIIYMLTNMLILDLIDEDYYNYELHYVVNTTIITL